MFTLLIFGGLFYTFYNLTGGGGSSSTSSRRSDTKIISHTRQKKGDGR